MNLKSKFLTFVFALVIFSFSSARVQASALYARSTDHQLNVGESFTVKIWLNTEGEKLNAVATNLSYPTDELEVESVTPGGDFPILAEQTVGAGMIKLVQGSIDPVEGEVSPATIIFRTKSPGDVNLNFLEDSAALRFNDSSNSLNLSQSQGANLVILENKVLGEDTQEMEPKKSATLSFTQLWKLLLGWF